MFIFVRHLTQTRLEHSNVCLPYKKLANINKNTFIPLNGFGARVYLLCKDDLFNLSIIMMICLYKLLNLTFGNLEGILLGVGILDGLGPGIREPGVRGEGGPEPAELRGE